MLATTATFPATSLIFPAAAPTRLMTGMTFFCKNPLCSGVWWEAVKLKPNKWFRLAFGLELELGRA